MGRHPPTHLVERELLLGSVQIGRGFQPPVDGCPHHGAIGGTGAGLDLLPVEARQLSLLICQRRNGVTDTHRLHASQTVRANSVSYAKFMFATWRREADLRRNGLIDDKCVRVAAIQEGVRD